MSFIITVEATNSELTLAKFLAFFYLRHHIVLMCIQDGKKITSTDHARLEYTDGHCSLSIDRVTLDDEAEYMCEARNEAGVATTLAELLVESKQSLRVRLVSSWLGQHVMKLRQACAVAAWSYSCCSVGCSFVASCRSGMSRLDLVRLDLVVPGCSIRSS